jgi:uncharacterized protein YgiM (DUF1202 family)
MSKLTALCLALLLMVATLLPLTQPVSAQDDPPATITAEVLYHTLYVRDYPGASANIVGQLHLGDVVTVSGYRATYRGGWLRIEGGPDGQAGWISRDYVALSRADWTHFVPEIREQPLTEEWPANTPPTSLPAWVNASSLNLRAAPERDASILAKLTQGTPVTILGTSVEGHIFDVFVYVRVNDTGQEGWVYSLYLELPSGRFALWDPRELPVLAIEDSAVNIPLQGQVIGYVDAPIGQHLRELPSTKGRSLGVLEERTLLAIHGRTNHEEIGWVYATVLATGQAGWLYDHTAFYPRHVGLPRYFYREALPILEPVAQPDLAAPVPGIDAYTTTLKWWNTDLYRLPRPRHSDFYEVAAHAPVTVSGRNLNSTWAYVTTPDGVSGWIYTSALADTGPLYRLPLLSTLDGTLTNRS